MSDQTGLRAASDYKLSSLVVVASSGDNIDVKNIMVEMNLYEDV